MAYVAPVHRPSSIRHALRIKLFSAEEDCLVISRANRIEIWRFTEHDDLALFHSQKIYGTVAMLEALRPKDSDTELLFVGTDRFDYFTLVWDDARQGLDTIDNFHDVGEKHLRDSQSQDRCIVDPSGRYMALLLWEGVLCVLRLKSRRDQARNIDWMDQVRLSELFIKACTFLYSETGHPKIAFLYQSQSERRDAKLSSYRLTSDDRDAVVSRFDATREREINLDLDDIGAALLIPVETSESERRHNVRKTSNNAPAEPHLGGLLVVGETSLVYIDDTTQATKTVTPRTPAVYVAWARFDSTHYFLADDQGVLRLLTIITDGQVVKKIEVSPIGKTSIASSLVYYPSRSLLFVGSHHGDSQLYRIKLTDDSTDDTMTDEPGKSATTANDKASGKKHEYCELVQTFSNIGPILDFTIMDMGNREDGKANEYASGQARIVTGSGVNKGGSLRSVRSGVGLEDIGILGDFSNVRALFPLRRRPTASGKMDTLVVSLLTETRVFTFDANGEVEEVTFFPGIQFDEETLLAARAKDNSFLVITAKSVTLSDGDNGDTLASWSPQDGKAISLASANDRWALLSIEGKLLVSLRIDKGLTLAAEKDFGDDQIAAIHAAPQFLDTGVVGTWMVGTVAVVDLATLQPTQASVSVRQKEDTASVPRSLALAQVMPTHLSGPTLFVAMDDGTVVTFSVSKEDRTLHSKKSVVLGTRRANLYPLPQPDGTYSIFATTEHPSLIYGSEGRIVYAAVTAQDANVVCPFDSDDFPDAIVVASLTSIKIARPDTQKQTHVQTIQMHETIRRIAYSPVEKVFALGCIGANVVNGIEVPTCSIKLVDETMFRTIGRPLPLDGEQGELVESVIRAEMLDSQGHPAERFLVGTSYVPQAAVDDGGSQGRVIVVGVDSERNPYIVSTHRMRGPCRRLAVLDGKIVLGLSKTVIISDYIETSNMSAKLKKIASFRAATFISDLAVYGNYIAVGDMMKSTTIVEYIPATRGSNDDDDDREKDVARIGGTSAGADSMDVDDNDGEKKATPATPAKLEGRARYYQASWVTAVCHIEGESWLEADGFGNLSVLERNANGVTEEDRRKLRATSEMNLGDMVNRMQPISVESNPNAMVHPKAFLATVEGALYMFGTVSPAAQDLLMRLQAKLDATVTGLGKTSFASYRGFRNQEREAAEPIRFIDGEMLERFLDLDDETQKQVAQGLGPSVEDLRSSIEELKRLH
ncbi:DNA damage-binding protein 1 [Sporothrix schenckii 1099-18]|uniref:DNA damage-binding protein 1 n=1 Tax=Sporothrix schenckii 1099-18 TaxID=1397361 RepID=A0A0F2M3V9_SPOSC|nr:DNA damage-binding protein 1 [Sporothrix schenckii 1099-18]KJR84393.1 DNA damage-binding protein 1 [Sporothrix schenckii 1099-18]